MNFGGRGAPGSSWHADRRALSSASLKWHTTSRLSSVKVSPKQPDGISGASQKHRGPLRFLLYRSGPRLKIPDLIGELFYYVTF